MSFRKCQEATVFQIRFHLRHAVFSALLYSLHPPDRSFHRQKQNLPHFSHHFFASKDGRHSKRKPRSLPKSTSDSHGKQAYRRSIPRVDLKFVTSFFHSRKPKPVRLKFRETARFQMPKNSN